MKLEHNFHQHDEQNLSQLNSPSQVDHLASQIRRFRLMTDQESAPPIDKTALTLIELCAWDKLPSDVARQIQSLGILYETWSDALASAELKRYQSEHSQ